MWGLCSIIFSGVWFAYVISCNRCCLGTASYLHKVIVAYRETGLPVTTGHHYVINTSIWSVVNGAAGLAAASHVSSSRGGSSFVSLALWVHPSPTCSSIPAAKDLPNFSGLRESPRVSPSSTSPVENMAPEIDVIILQSIRCSVIWPVWVPRLKPIPADWINPFIIPQKFKCLMFPAYPRPGGNGKLVDPGK